TVDVLHFHGPGLASGESTMGNLPLSLLALLVVAAPTTAEIKASIKVSVAKEYIARVAWSPDGKSVSTVSKNNVLKLIRSADGKELRTIDQLKGEFPGKVAFSPDGKRLALSGEKTVAVWELEAGKKVAALKTNDSNAALAFSPDGGLLAVAGMRKVQLWD